MNVGILLVIFVFSFSTEFFGQQIHCDFGSAQRNQAAIDQYCLYNGLYIVLKTANFSVRALTSAEKLYFKKMNHNRFAHDGIMAINTPNTEIKYLAYYRLITFILLGQVNIIFFQIMPKIVVEYLGFAFILPILHMEGNRTEQSCNHLCRDATIYEQG